MSDLSTRIDAVPGIGKPAARALAEQGYDTLQQLDGADWRALAALHGVGPASGARLQTALEGHGASFANPPKPDTRTHTFTEGTTDKVANGTKTTTTDESPERFLDTLAERRTKEGRTLLELFGAATGEEAVMWGPSMIGYGSYHYKYASGREGNAFRIGFSPRKANIALYGLQTAPDAETLLPKLGKHKVGVGCVWVNKLDDIDLDVLRTIVEQSWAVPPEDY